MQVQVLLGVLPLPAAAGLALVPQLPLLQDLADQGVRLQAAVKTIKSRYEDDRKTSAKTTENTAMKTTEKPGIKTAERARI